MFLPWYFTVTLAVVMMFFNNFFLEGVLAGFVIESLYSVPASNFHNNFGVITVSLIVALGVSEFAKKKIRFFDK